jgi:hypothetical protein
VDRRRNSQKGLTFAIDAAFPAKFESPLGHTIVWQKFLACVQKAAQDGGMKAIPRTRPSNVTPFILERCWALDGLDQTTMQWLSKIAKRKNVAVADVIYEAIELLVAEWERKAELETKIIKFWPLDGTDPIAAPVSICESCDGCLAATDSTRDRA